MPPPRLRQFHTLLPPSSSSTVARCRCYTRSTPFSTLPRRPRPRPQIQSQSRQSILSQARAFTTTGQRQNWLIPRRKLKTKDMKGRPRLQKHGSTRGTTIVWGDYGLRMRDHDRRVSADQLRNGEDAIRRRLRGTNYRIYKRISAATAVFTKGNESRMGTGKGGFDHWASRIPVSRIIFEIISDAHEQVIRDALRLAANKMPGLYEFVKKGDPPVMGLTRLGGEVTAESLQKPRKKLPADIPEPTDHGIKVPDNVSFPRST